MMRSESLGQLLPWTLLAVAVGLAAWLVDSPAALLQLWRPWAEVGILAVGMTAVILTGGIDLSVGSMVALGTVVFGLVHAAGGGWLGAGVALVACGLAGLGNGILVVVGIAPLVATLTTMALYGGLALALSGGARITGFPREFTALGQGSWAGLPNPLWVFAAVSLLGMLIVHRTRYGRYLLAAGDNRVAARFAAVPLGRMELAVYAAMGLLAGVAAILATARNGAAVPDAGQGLELRVIACVVLGGTRVTGGMGGVGRTLLGLAILANLEIGLRLLGSRRIVVPWSEVPWRLNANGRLIVVGVLLIAVAVATERLTRRARS